MAGHPGRNGDGKRRNGGKKRAVKKRGTGFPGLNPELAAAHDAETAAEVAGPAAKPRERPRADGDAGRNGRRTGAKPAVSDAGRAVGLLALALAVVSLFVWSLPFGLAAAALGWFSFREGARGLGAWAVIIGLAAALSYLVLIPILAAWM